MRITRKKKASARTQAWHSSDFAETLHLRILFLFLLILILRLQKRALSDDSGVGVIGLHDTNIKCPRLLDDALKHTLKR